MVTAVLSDEHKECQAGCQGQACYQHTSDIKPIKDLGIVMTLLRVAERCQSAQSSQNGDASGWVQKQGE